MPHHLISDVFLWILKYWKMPFHLTWRLIEVIWIAITLSPWVTVRLLSNLKQVKYQKVDTQICHWLDNQPNWIHHNTFCIPQKNISISPLIPLLLFRQIVDMDMRLRVKVRKRNVTDRRTYGGVSISPVPGMWLGGR